MGTADLSVFPYDKYKNKFNRFGTHTMNCMHLGGHDLHIRSQWLRLQARKIGGRGGTGSADWPSVTDAISTIKVR